MVYLHGLNRPWFKNIAVGLHLKKRERFPYYWVGYFDRFLYHWIENGREVMPFIYIVLSHIVESLYSKNVFTYIFVFRDRSLGNKELEKREREYPLHRQPLDELPFPVSLYSTYSYRNRDA